MDLIDQLLRMDRQLFLAINGARSSMLDGLFILVSEPWPWVPLYAFFLYIIQRRFGWRGLWWSVPVIGAMIFMTDTGSVLFFKDTVKRLRPCHADDLRGMVFLVDGRCGGRFGFISSHPSNHFGIAAFMIGAFHGRGRWVGWALIGWAALIAYSRVYLGQHYPLDVMCGAMYGFAIGMLFFMIFRAISLRTSPVK
jgi:undecaprenyl-diphosphatase